MGRRRVEGKGDGTIGKEWGMRRAERKEMRKRKKGRGEEKGRWAEEQGKGISSPLYMFAIEPEGNKLTPGTVTQLSLGSEIRRLLENELGEMGALTYKKQCWDMGLNPDGLKMGDVNRVARGVARALAPIVGQERSKAMEKNIIRFKILVEMAEVNKEQDPAARARKETNLSLSLGEIEATLHEHESAEKYYKQAFRAAQNANLPIMESKAYRGLGHLHREINEWEEAMKWFKKAMKLSEGIGDNMGRVDSYRGLGRVLWITGSFDEAMDIFKEAMGISEKIKDKEGMGILFIELGNVYNEKGDLMKAEKSYTDAIPLLIGVKKYSELARAYNNVGDIMLQRKEWEKAIECFQKCKEEGEKVLDERMTGWALFNMAEAQLNLGEVETAQKNITKSLATLRVVGDERGISSALKLMGDVYAAQKKWNKADEAFTESLEYAEQTKSPHYLCRAYVSWAFSKKAEGRKKEAKEYALKAQEILGDIDVAELKSKIEGLMEELG